MPTNKPTRSLGFIEQDPSDQDKIFQGVAPLPGATADSDLRKWCSPIEDQKNLNSCVGNSTCGALEMLRIKQGIRHLDLSRLFCYYNARSMRGDQGRDVGCIVRFAFASLKTLGTCAEAVWPYNTSQVLVKPPLLAYRNAYAARISKFEYIPGNGKPRIDAIVNALAGGQPIVFGINVTESFMYATNDHPKIAGAYVGQHAMMMAGYNLARNEILLRNSWGLNWAGSGAGYGWIPAQYLDDHRAADLWVCYETPNIA